MVQNYHDSMALCGAYGPPHIFSTFTCNPKWPEIAQAIRFELGQKPNDRSDMVTRVYHMKLDEYITSIKNGEAFGPIKAGVLLVLFMIAVLSLRTSPS
jgi:hypothetical protein